MASFLHSANVMVSSTSGILGENGSLREKKSFIESEMLFVALPKKYN